MTDGRPGGPTNRVKLRILGGVAVVLVVVGIVLIVTGGDDAPTGPSTTTTTASDGGAPAVTLPLDDTSVAAVSALGALTIPDGMADFLTTYPEARTQLDVTFTLPPEQVDAFVSDSGLPELVEGTQVVMHSSPLWKVTPEGTVSGGTDTLQPAAGGTAVARAVETVPEGDRVRVRMVLTPSA